MCHHFQCVKRLPERDRLQWLPKPWAPVTTQAPVRGKRTLPSWVETCWLCSGSPLGRDDPRRVTGMALCLYCPWVLCPPSVCTSVLVGLSASQAKPC